ncbi:MAG: OmpA family protein [Bdellovibrionales bacterium]|nr:OmpA family protein [Bdellovibrionales bacterium]
MKSKKKLNKITALVALIFTLGACSSKPDIKELPKSADAKQEITNLELAIEDSKDKNYNLLAPDSFKNAKDSLREAKSMEKEDAKKEKVLKEVALGNAYLERAEENSQDNQKKMQDILAARQAAIDAKADALFPKDLAKMDKKLTEETEKLEKDKDDELKEKRSGFITGYSDLELAAIKKYHLGESKFLIDDSIKNGARELAPKTLSATNKKYKEVDLFITQNRHDTSDIEARSAEVLVEASNLARTTSTARGISAASPEETALKMRAEQERFNQTQDELFEEQGTARALAAQNAEMSEEQKLNAVYENARSKFTSEEAEVYKQGSNLVIRLRALEFPKAQAVLKAEDFALLKKVEDVIAGFDKSRVIVEGHTDSTGDQKLNQDLSEKRAEAVKKYLEANITDKVSEIESKGFGYEKPLSSNKTASGRAQNRRVDVIIEPVQL